MVRNLIEECGSTKKIKKALSTGKNLIVKLKDGNGNLIHNREDIIKTATKFYENLYQKREEKERKCKRKIQRNAEIEPQILKREIEVAINRLKKGKAAAPDMVENETIKITKDILVPHLTNLFSEIIENNWVPEQWYTPEIILLYKKGCRENIENYKPISLTANISKIVMTIVKNRI